RGAPRAPTRAPTTGRPFGLALCRMTVRPRVGGHSPWQERTGCLYAGAYDLPVARDGAFMATERIFLEDSYVRQFEAVVTESLDGWSVLSRTAFHPGGGGQPCDQGSLTCGGSFHLVTGMREDGETLWHRVEVHLPPGETVRGTLDWPRRHALMRHHCLLHVVNALAHQRYGGLVSG